MKTSEAIQALRPLTNWVKATAKLEEVLNLIEERESIIEKSELRLTVLTQKIEDADKKYAESRSTYENDLRQFEEEIVTKKLRLEDDFEKRQKEISEDLLSDAKDLKDAKDRNRNIKNEMQEEIAMLSNSIRDKRQELNDLAEKFNNAITNTKQFISNTENV